MRHRFSGRLIASLHVLALTAISVVFAKNGAMWAPVALYLSGAVLLWFASLPGTQRLHGPRWINRDLARGLARHGAGHGGYARRRDWDRAGLNARLLLQFVCLVCTGLALIVASGSSLLLAFLAGASFSLGVEGGFAAFGTGDEAVLRRHRRSVVAPDHGEP
ncbi:hypothetical protein [Lysobacter auxotrophicus]|uniref:Uncharacterized protein n=1 Tax=Lysobacter auxotrophicus TaxID=2992573 RepID=A0ABN6UIA4_9GAMM|nr:hypothetical protein [Lysobacter auxotrophicus]BDU16043.1 hypothetical protein LA521A_12440 [Lysobacter auxotrophicus]